MTEEEKKKITREKHPGRVAQGYKPAALTKKRKEEILCNKEQSSVLGKEQSTEQSTVQPTVQPTEHSTVQSSDTYAYGVGMLVKRINHQNDVICFRKTYIING